MNRLQNVIAIAGLALVAGCAQNEPAAAPPTTSTPPATGASPAAYRNDKGQLVCAVTGETIASEKDASSFIDYKNKRYYFCCGMCPPEFKKDPEKYADGKAIKAGTNMKM
jgi:YHS domain-containing protein